MKMLLALLTCVSIGVSAQTADPLITLAHSYCYTSAITGREEEAREFIQSLFARGTFRQDKLGNLLLTIGSGAPRKLLTAPLDEPGYVVSNITSDGYLRITPIGYGHLGTMYHQFMEGNEIKINTEKGSAYGVAIIPSSHYEGLRLVRESSRGVHPWQETIIDVGLSSPSEVNDRGIRLLDPLTANKKPGIINNEFLAAPSAGPKAGVMALAAVAQTLLQAKVKGTIVIAFTTLELINGKGLEAVVTKEGPFDQVIRFNRFLNASRDVRAALTDKDLPYTSTKEAITKPSVGYRSSYTPLDWDSTKIYSVGIPSTYTNTPVEMVHVSAIAALTQTWLRAVEDRTWKVTVPTSAQTKPAAPVFKTFNEESSLLSKFIATYGVSGSEQPVRELVLSQLPAWAKPVTDAQGNIILTFGKGKEHIAFVAHMDEVGYVVDSIRTDGRLVLGQRGGFFNSVWEAHAALVHTGKRISQESLSPLRTI